MKAPEHFRAKVLFDRQASLEAAAELLAYNENPFVRARVASPVRFPLETELHVEAWQRYADEAEEQGVLATLQKRFPQLAFPIQEGIYQTEAYQRATRRGAAPDDMPTATGLQLKRPGKLRLLLHVSLAGTIPVLISGHRDDFVALVRAFTKHNEPVPIPSSMGACIVAGYTNWDRIAQLRRRWEAENPSDRSAAGWAEELRQRILPHKELYQDRFIILSDGPYSGVPAKVMNMAAAEWRRISVTIRLEHECTHHLTRRLFSSMRNNVLDELLADYRGIVAAIGRYRADWFLRFMGLESFPDYRTGGRLENYRGDPPLSDEAFSILKGLVKDAAENLERFDHDHLDELATSEAQGWFIVALSRLTLEEMACEEADRLVKQAWDDVKVYQEV